MAPTVDRPVVDSLIESQQRRIDSLEKELDDAVTEMNRCKMMIRLARGEPVPAHLAAAAAGTRAPIQKPKRSRDTAVVPAAALAAVSLAAAEKVANRTKQATTRYWTTLEHEKFLVASRKFGPKNYAAISQYVGTRNPKQVRTHAQKYEMRLAREDSRRKVAIYAEELNVYPVQSLQSGCAQARNEPSAEEEEDFPSVPDVTPKSPVPTGPTSTFDSPLAVQALGDTHHGLFDDDGDFGVVDDAMAVPSIVTDEDSLKDIDLDDVDCLGEVDCSRWLDV